MKSGMNNEVSFVLDWSENNIVQQRSHQDRHI